jgi:hypothetical protein
MELQHHSAYYFREYGLDNLPTRTAMKKIRCFSNAATRGSDKTLSVTWLPPALPLGLSDHLVATAAQKRGLWCESCRDQCAQCQTLHVRVVLVGLLQTSTGWWLVDGLTISGCYRAI